MAQARCRVGCSGWMYKHWRDRLYAKDLPPKRWLERYAEVFDTVEINNSFYRLPEAETFEAWKKRSPPGFLFAVKASRFLTHMKKLKDPQEPLCRFFDRAEKLGRKLGPVLYQLPPRWPVNLDRLERFLLALPPRRRHAMEFRERSWYSDEVCRALVKAGVALCLHDMQGSESPRIAIGPFLYVRFHGSGPRYGGRYPDALLSGWAHWIAGRIREGQEGFVYFNNDAEGHAIRDAMRLREMIAERG